MRWGVAALLPALWAGCGVTADQARFTVEPCGETAAFDPRAWTFESAPVLGRGEVGAWDSVDVLNPSVVRWGDQLLNLYSGFDGERWHTGAAWSDDGEHWVKSDANPVLSPRAGSWEGGYIAANGAALVDDGRVRYWYQAGPRNRTSIGLAESADGEHWDRVGDGPVFEAGARGTWDEAGVGDPYVVACGGAYPLYYLYYLGQDRFGVQRLGLARSEDGVRWQRSHLNPLLEPGGRGDFDELGLGEPAVVRTTDGWRMLYTGRDEQERRRMGWAHSVDGLRWEKRGPVHAGGAEWNGAVVCDTTFLIDEDQLRVWYGGGSWPSPDEGLDGAIGEAATGEVSGGYSGSM